MKKLCIIILSTILTLPLFSQDFESGDLNKKFYVRAGLSTPTWTYYGFKDRAALKAGLGVESRIGGIFEIGGIFMLNGINVGNGMRFGINVDFVSFKTQILKLGDGENIYNGFIGSKIGPSFTYAISKAIAFDVFAKLNPVWGAAVYTNLQNIDEEFNIYYGYVQMMYSFGINVKMSVIMIGFEYDLGSLKLQNNATDGYWDPANPDWDPELNPQMTATKVAMDGFNITIGFVF
ncbi:MAG: hypothetical protein QM503_09060 [Bacteroidota bacterium]